jgi:hypothetical protein
MVTPISHAAPAQAPDQTKAAPTATQQAAPSKPQANPTDTVQISTAAQQILKESIENPAQTTREAAGGDPQAKRLLAKEAADKLQ